MPIDVLFSLQLNLRDISYLFPKKYYPQDQFFHYIVGHGGEQGVETCVSKSNISKSVKSLGVSKNETQQFKHISHNLAELMQWKDKILLLSCLTSLKNFLTFIKSVTINTIQCLFLSTRSAITIQLLLLRDPRIEFDWILPDIKVECSKCVKEAKRKFTKWEFSYNVYGNVTKLHHFIYFIFIR